MIELVHILMAILACWRLTEIVTIDRVSAPFRKRYPWYIWSCPRCVSVWAAGATTAILYFFPWGNWPLGIAWLYLWHLDWVIAKRKANFPRQLIIRQDADGVFTVAQSDFNQADLGYIGEELKKLAPQKEE